MFQTSALPHVTFVGAESEQTLALSQCSPQIQAFEELVASSTAPNATVGLLFQTGPALILTWLGVLAAGRTPLILQYPNEKMSKVYWRDSLRDTITRCNVATLLCSPELSTHNPDQLAPCIFIGSIDPCKDSSPDISFPEEGTILQLSSGTTGFKKPIRFTFEALKKHAHLYNETLCLTPNDRIVSWLPLYHDMGFIACFVTPLLLGIPIVMIDPITWVRTPRLLFEAIERHQGTVCYMPNFGFEVMAKLGQSGPFPSMRHWISCSEPTYPATLERFLAATGTSPANVSTCYGMAENVFAVTQSSGMRIIERDGQSYVSCGRPISGTEVKNVDGEFFVQSPHSLTSYEGSADVRDEAGFYATGDIGFLEGGEIVITGRKQDLANIGGRKFLLNDLDFAVAQLFPQSAGRIASLSVFDPTGGTEKVLFLIEDDTFWLWNRSPEPTRLIRENTGLEWLEVHFVPRHFVTKTSSGKVNRKRTIADWQAFQSGVHLQRDSSGEGDISRKLAEQFPGIPTNTPVGEELDSLGQLILRIFCEEHGIAYGPDLTLDSIAESKHVTSDTKEAQIFSIIALVDGWRLGFEAPAPFIDKAFLEAISNEVGIPLHFEHICVPPALILFSDLIFHDYFLPRNPDPAYAVVSSLLTKIKNASLILIDDEDNFRTPPFCAYPVLDRQFTMETDADLLGHRMQRYTQNHHLLPRRVVLGRDITPETVNPVLQMMESYLQTPILKMAFHAEFRAHTGQWDFCDFRDFNSDSEKITNTSWLERFQDVLLHFIRQRRTEFRTRTGEPVNRFLLMDTPHFCSFILNREAVDFIVEEYTSFCLVGAPSSLPYLQQELDRLGKPYFFSSQATPANTDYECLVLIGGVGGRMPVTDKPTFDFIHAREEGHGGGRPHNVSQEVWDLCPPLTACDEKLYRSLLGTHGVLIGNYLLNHTIAQPATR